MCHTSIIPMTLSSGIYSLDQSNQHILTQVGCIVADDTHEQSKKIPRSAVEGREGGGEGGGEGGRVGGMVI